METLIYLLLAVLLILLNAFFVLAEFAIVKARTTQIDALAARGDRRARRVQRAQDKMDAFLSVCQVGITLASIGLGFVGEPALAHLFKPVVHWLGAGAATEAAAHAIAITLSYIIVSFLHIVIGEQIPKFLALRLTVPSALLVAYPMLFFEFLFRPSIWLLTGMVNGALRLLRIPPATTVGDHGEDELRLILGESQAGGMMSFRRLLYMENIMDMSGLKVRHAMHPRSQVRTLRAGAPAAENDRVIAENRYSRYPLIADDPERPLGFVHVKDLYLREHAGQGPADLRASVKPCLIARERQPLEALLADMQSRGHHMALVYDENNRWTGIITMEDAIEEVIGTIEEEYPLEAPLRLSDLLSRERVIVGAQGGTILEATRDALGRLNPADLPMPLDAIMTRVADREKLGSSYVGRRLAIPHARIEKLPHPMVVAVKLAESIPAPRSEETIDLLFILLTPAEQPRIHQMLLARIAGIFTSDFLEDRLCSSESAADMYNSICTAEQATLG